jgi:hypothetical protein
MIEQLLQRHSVLDFPLASLDLRLLPPSFTPTLALPRRGGGKRRIGADPENYMPLQLLQGP